MIGLLSFLKELRENNNREWFQANKERYNALHSEHIEIVGKLIGHIADFDPEIAKLEPSSCVYRIYRDMRFSADKTPYKTHFGAYMTGFGGRTSSYAGYYLHIEPGNSMVSGGVWCPTPPMLKRLRKDIYDGVEEFVGILENKDFKRVYGSLEGEQTKRIPEGFPKDFEHEELLRYKSYIVSHALTDRFFSKADWIDEVVENFRILQSFNKFLNYTIGEFFGKG